ncbi:hypothetical protein, partial [Acinetobacter oleivorans]|uniref:hypothetical protein n=1 Tax=Acinetobacter oleivorans TaxID=1148157 RepID=UPI001C099C8C
FAISRPFKFGCFDKTLKIKFCKSSKPFSPYSFTDFKKLKIKNKLLIIKDSVEFTIYRIFYFDPR